MVEKGIIVYKIANLKKLPSKIIYYERMVDFNDKIYLLYIHVRRCVIY